MARHVGEVMAETLLQEIDGNIQHTSRVEHRLAGYMAVLRSDDYVYVRCCVPLELMQYSPDPIDMQISKRSWEAQMQTWRRTLKRVREYNESG